MQTIRKKLNLIPISKGILQSSWAHFCSQKYRKTTFDWQPSQQNKPQNSQNYRNQNTYQKSNSNQTTQQKNYPNSQNTYQRNTSNQNQGPFQKKKELKFIQNDLSEQQSAFIDENDSQQSSTKSYVLNPNMSLLGQVIGLKTVDDVCRFYESNYEFYSPRIIATSARQLGSLLDKQKNLSTLKSQKTIIMIHKHVEQIMDKILPKLRTEEVQKQEVKNLLFFIKKILIDHKSLIHIHSDAEYFNESLYQKALQFRDKLLMIFLDKSLDYSHYEIPELVEIHFELIKFSQFFEVEEIYKCIEERQKLIESTVKPQFLFSATTFMTNVKQIESNFQRLNYRNEQQKTQQKSPLAQKYRNRKTKEELNRTRQLREKCYEIFFKRWIYHIDDLNEFIKLSDIIKIWPTVIFCNSGNKMLLKGINGPTVLKSISKIIERNNSKIDQMINGNPRILSNSFAMFYILSRKHPSDQLLKELVEKVKNMIGPFSAIDKGRLKMKMKSTSNTWRQDQVIDSNEEMDTIQLINSL